MLFKNLKIHVTIKEIVSIKGGTMRKYTLIFLIVAFIFSSGCSTRYKAQPVSFKMPSSYENSVTFGSVEIGATAFSDIDEAKKAFGFDIRGAGMLPVQIVFDNQGKYSLKIIPEQTFLEDEKGNLWPILSSKVAYERATKYAQTNKIFKEGAYHGFWGAMAGSIIGAAVGIVTGENVGEAAGKGAAIGAAAGATMGGAQVYESDEPRRTIIGDLKEKALKNNAVKPKVLANGFLFFPGEAESANLLRLQILEKETGKIHVLKLKL